ncbi:MAG: alpha/beta fold hydrolase [Spirochaetia bacterium]|jgi:carboxylesterase
MRWQRIPAETTTLSSALPRTLEGGEDGALLIHGFTGTPRDLAALGEALHRRGLTVHIPRLPGHGTNGIDFLCSGWRDWLRGAADAYADLRARCRRVHLVGHSMGGNIAVLLAARFAVQRLVLLAPALRTRNPLLPLSPLMSLLFTRVRWPLERPLVFDDEDTAVLMREYWQWRYPTQAASLLRLKRMARRSLRRVTADTLTVTGAQDRNIPRSVFGLIESRRRTGVREHLLIEDGTHHLLAAPGGERVMEAVAQWLLRE